MTADRERVPAGLRVLEVRPPGGQAPEARRFRTLAEIVAERREAEWLPGLHKVLERNVLAVLAGRRGSLKSFIGLDWCLRAALAGAGVAILSGEGAGLDRRVDAFMRTHAPDRRVEELCAQALERAVNLCDDAVLDEIVSELRRLPFELDLVMIDTLSKFSPGLDENSNADVAEFLGALTARIRDELECSVLLIAHTGHGSGDRPRGASVLMCNPDAEYMVERPDVTGMAVTVSRERFKDTPALPVLAYEARSVDLGRQDALGEPVTSLALHTADAPPARALRSAGKNQEAALVALREWARTRPDGVHIASPELVALLREAGTKDRRRRPEVIKFLTESGILLPAVGGFTVNRSVL